MNKIMNLKLREIHVINLFIFSLLLFSCTSNKENATEDILILNKIIKEIKTDNYKIVMDTSKNNNYLISRIEELKEYDFNNIFKLDSLKQILGIENDKIINSIFNKKKYDYLISQKFNSDWNFNKLSISNRKKIETSQIHKSENNISISKPVFTQNKKYALVYVCEKTRCGIRVLDFTENQWRNHTIISTMFISKKAKIMILPN